MEVEILGGVGWGVGVSGADLPSTNGVLKKSSTCEGLKDKLLTKYHNVKLRYKELFLNSNWKYNYSLVVLLFEAC